MAQRAKQPAKRKAPRAKPSHAALGRAIAQIREERDWTQAVVAKKAGLHPTYLSGVENGSRNPTWTVLSQISQGLGMKLSELVKRAERTK